MLVGKLLMQGVWFGLVLMCLLFSNSVISATSKDAHWRAAPQQNSIGRTPRFRPLSASNRRLDRVQRFRPKASSRLFQGKQRFVPNPFREEQKSRGTGRWSGYSAGTDRQFRPDRRDSIAATDGRSTYNSDAINQQFRPLPRRSGRYRYPSRALRPVRPEALRTPEYSVPPAAPREPYGGMWSYR